MAHDFEILTVIISRLRPKPQWAKQSVKLIGMGCQEFDEAVSGMVTITQKMVGLYRPGMFQTWMPDNENENFTLDFSNRYTPPHLTKGHIPYAFDRAIDPHGHLE
jgi:hypothetical protein